jgi:hypothetical protein
MKKFILWLLILQAGSITKINAMECFIAGTMILMADGTEKPIEKVQAGDSIISYDVTTGTMESQRIACVARPDIKTRMAGVIIHEAVIPKHKGANGVNGLCGKGR